MIDFLGKNGTKGNLAAMLSSGITAGAMRPYIGRDGKAYITSYSDGDINDIKSYVATPTTNATLLKDDWIELDKTVLEVSRSRLGGIQDLRDNNLVKPLNNAFAMSLFQTQNASDSLNSNISMNGMAKGENDRQDFSLDSIPLPIIHVDYEINGRVLAASRRSGNALDTSAAANATRRINEQLENMLFTNTTFAFGGGTIYSYVNYPDRSPVSLALAWDNASQDGAGILADVVKMKNAAIADLHYGPWMLYIPTLYETVLDGDYSTSYAGVTIRDRILKVAGIKGIKTVDTLPANNVLLVQMTSDVIRLIDGMPITNIQWKTEGEFVSNYKVMTIQVPQIRSDYNGKTGIIHLA